MEFKNVLVMVWGIDLNGNNYIKTDFKLPKNVPVTVNYDNRNIVGHANNFKITDEGILCDIVVDRKVTDTVAPSFTTDSNPKEPIIIDGFMSISFINDHANKECNDNLK